MPTVLIPPPYRGPTQGTGELRVEGSTVLECLRAIESRHPGFLAQVVTPEGSVHRFVRLFRNGDPLEGRALEAPLAREDRVEIVAAIAGG